MIAVVCANVVRNNTIILNLRQMQRKRTHGRQGGNVHGRQGVAMKKYFYQNHFTVINKLQYKVEIGSTYFITHY